MLSQHHEVSFPVDGVFLCPLLLPFGFPLEVPLKVHDTAPHGAVQRHAVRLFKGDDSVEGEGAVVFGVVKVTPPQQVQLSGIDGIKDVALLVIGDEIHTVSQPVAGIKRRKRVSVADIADSQQQPVAHLVGKPFACRLYKCGVLLMIEAVTLEVIGRLLRITAIDIGHRDAVAKCQIIGDGDTQTVDEGELVIIDLAVSRACSQYHQAQGSGPEMCRSHHCLLVVISLSQK